MSSVLSRCSHYLKTYPLLKGVLAYGCIWPVGSLVQQTIAGQRWDSYDWKKCARFSFYGAFFVAPTLYGWIRITTLMWPRSNLKTGIQKALVEQVTYGPAAMCCFFFFMSLLEGHTVSESAHEVRQKLWPTWKVGFCFWPIFQTLNFAFVPERNRVPIISLGSLMWTIFLAYMKQLELEEKQALENGKRNESDPKIRNALIPAIFEQVTDHR